MTLDDLCEMVQEGHDFVVQDAKSGADLTRSVLTQIIVEQESRGQNLLPTNFLRQLIGFYGDNIQSVVPNYLEHTLDIFAKNQEQIRENINKSIEGMNTMPTMGNMDVFTKMPTSLEEINKRNIDMFQRTMKMFTPLPRWVRPRATRKNVPQKLKRILMNSKKSWISSRLNKQRQDKKTGTS